MARPKEARRKQRFLMALIMQRRSLRKYAAKSIAQEIATIGEDIATLNAQRKQKKQS